MYWLFSLSIVIVWQLLAPVDKELFVLNFISRNNCVQVSCYKREKNQILVYMYCVIYSFSAHIHIHVRSYTYTDIYTYKQVYFVCENASGSTNGDSTNNMRQAMHESAAKAAPVSLLFRERLRLHAARQID